MRHISVFFYYTDPNRILPLRGVTRNNTRPKSRVSESVAVGSAWRMAPEVLLFHVWQNNGKPGRQINVIRRKELVHFSQERGKQYWKKGIGNIDPPTGLRYRVPEILTLCSCGYRDRSNSARIIKLLHQR